jgi:deferrochelatase/peroxidase EfeB
MMKITEHDVLTNQIVEREATDDELAKDQADFISQQQAKLIVEEQKAAALAKLGLTADELAALFS